MLRIEVDRNHVGTFGRHRKDRKIGFVDKLLGRCNKAELEIELGRFTPYGRQRRKYVKEQCVVVSEDSESAGCAFGRENIVVC